MKPIYCPICNGPICSNINYKCDQCFYHRYLDTFPKAQTCLQQQQGSGLYCHCPVENILSFYYNKYPEFYAEFNGFPSSDMEHSYNSSVKVKVKRIIHFIEMIKDAENAILLEDDLFEM